MPPPLLAWHVGFSKNTTIIRNNGVKSIVYRNPHMLIFLPIRYKRSMCPIRCIFLQYNTAFTTATCTAEFHNCVKLVGFKGQRSGRHCDWPWLVTWFNEICARGRALINLKKTKRRGTTQKCVFRLLNLGFKDIFI